MAFPTGPDHLGPASKKLTISTDGVMAEAKDLGEAAVEGLEALDLKQVILNVITDPTIVGTAAPAAPKKGKRNVNASCEMHILLFFLSCLPASSRSMSGALAGLLAATPATGKPDAPMATPHCLDMPPA